MQIKYIVLIEDQNDKLTQPILSLLVNAWSKQIPNAEIKIFRSNQTENIGYNPNISKNGIITPCMVPAFLTVNNDSDVILLANIYNLPVNYVKYLKMVQSTSDDTFIYCDDIYYSVGTFSKWNQYMANNQDQKIINFKYSDYFKKYTRSICILGPTLRELNLYSDFDLKLQISKKPDFVDRMSYFLNNNSKNMLELKFDTNDDKKNVNELIKMEDVIPTVSAPIISLNQIYDQVYIINLKSRTDRYQKMVDEMKNQMITNYQFYEAIRPSYDDICNWNEKYCHHEVGRKKNNFRNYQIGSFGCLQSHINVIQNAVNLNYKRILILEDDTVFIRPIDDLTKIIHEIDNNFDVLYMAINNVTKSKFHSANFNKVTKGLAACAYIITRPVMLYILENIKNTTLEIDLFYVNIVQPRFNCYVVNPQMTTQRPDYSDILCRRVNYANFFRR